MKYEIEYRGFVGTIEQDEDNDVYCLDYILNPDTCERIEHESINGSFNKCEEKMRQVIDNWYPCQPKNCDYLLGYEQLEDLSDEY